MRRWTGSGASVWCTTFCLYVLAAVAAIPTHGQAGPPTATQPGPTSRPQAELTVAVLDFDSSTPGEPNLGKQIGETLAIMLSGERGFRLVDRATLPRALQELELNLSGVVETEQAVKVGKVVGARLLVVGKAFVMGQQTFITAKLIGTETSLVDGVLVKKEGDADMGELVMELAAKVAQRLREVGPRLVADEDTTRDPLPGLKASLAGVRKPVIAVIIPEQHARVPARQVPDPAVETEIKLLLRECGFTVKDVPQNELADFARALRKNGPGSWPRTLAGVDCVIVGEGFSEFAARIGNLLSCAARVEINVIDRTSGRIVLADRTTERAVDLSENIAAKKALEKAGRVLGVRVLEHFQRSLPRESANAP
ncbi:MAG: CsgG/HfaB family protein [Phycisphaerae bacterium]